MPGSEQGELAAAGIRPYVKRRRGPGMLLRLQRLHFSQGAQAVARALSFCAEHEAGVLRDAWYGVRASIIDNM